MFRRRRYLVTITAAPGLHRQLHVCATSKRDAFHTARRFFDFTERVAYARSEVTALPVEGKCRHGDLGATESVADVRIWSGTEGGPIGLGPPGT